MSEFLTQGPLLRGLDGNVTRVAPKAQTGVSKHSKRGLGNPELSIAETGPLFGMCLECLGVPTGAIVLNTGCLSVTLRL